MNHVAGFSNLVFAGPFLVASVPCFYRAIAKPTASRVILSSVLFACVFLAHAHIYLWLGVLTFFVLLWVLAERLFGKREEEIGAPLQSRVKARLKDCRPRVRCGALHRGPFFGSFLAMVCFCFWRGCAKRGCGGCHGRLREQLRDALSSDRSDLLELLHILHELSFRRRRSQVACPSRNLVPRLVSLFARVQVSGAPALGTLLRAHVLFVLFYPERNRDEPRRGLKANRCELLVRVHHGHTCSGTRFEVRAAGSRDRDLFSNAPFSSNVRRASRSVSSERSRGP